MIYKDDFIKHIPFLIGLYFTMKDILNSKSDSIQLSIAIICLSILIILFTCIRYK